MRLRTKVILGAILLNAITFVVARVWWSLRGELAATLETHIGDPEDVTMTYLIAGNLNQADTAFKFMESELGSNYTFVQFNTKGWSAKATAKLIAKDIRDHGYYGRIFTISLGDHVARYLEQELGRKIEVYAINPCPNRDALQSPFRTVLRFATPFAETLCHTLGWVSYLPIVPAFGGKYSLALLIDQYWNIYYDYPPLGASQTYGVICSTEDSFLDNDELGCFYLDANIEYVNAGHSDIVNSADQYNSAIRSLLDKE